MISFAIHCVYFFFLFQLSKLSKWLPTLSIIHVFVDVPNIFEWLLCLKHNFKIQLDINYI